MFAKSLLCDVESISGNERVELLNKTKEGKEWRNGTIDEDLKLRRLPAIEIYTHRSDLLTDQ